jgi:hypothetical protein
MTTIFQDNHESIFVTAEHVKVDSIQELQVVLIQNDKSIYIEKEI